MKRVLCLRLLNWPVQRQRLKLSAAGCSRIAIHTVPPSTEASSGRRRKSDHDVDLRFVREIFPVARHSAAVICVSEEAWKSGVRPGMPLAEARSMVDATPAYPRASSLPNSVLTQFVEWVPAEDRQALLELAELTRRFAPIVALDEMPVPDCLLLDITGCGPLFGGESSLAEQLLKRLSGHGFTCQAAISDSIATAWAFAHPEGHFLQAAKFRRVQRSGRIKQRPEDVSDWNLPVIVIPPGQCDSWLSNLPVAVARVASADIDVLLQLGLRTVQQIQQLPVDDLPSRLTELTIRRLRQLRNAEPEILCGIPETHPVRAAWAGEFPATSRNESSQVVEHLVALICEQLERRRVGAVRLECQLTDDVGLVTSVMGDVIRPTQSAQQFIDVLSLRLERLPFGNAIRSVSIHATTAPLPVARQRNLFGDDDQAQPVDELAALVSRLSSRLGAQAVLSPQVQATPVPEEMIRLVPLMNSGDAHEAMVEDRLVNLVSPESVSHSAALPVDRPLRLLAVPMLLGDSTADPLKRGIVWNGQRFDMSDVTGPERIQTQWWHEVAVHRDYFRVRSRAGSQFWIYRDLNSNQWYLHGIFD